MPAAIAEQVEGSVRRGNRPARRPPTGARREAGRGPATGGSRVFDHRTDTDLALVEGPSGGAKDPGAGRRTAVRATVLGARRSDVRLGSGRPTRCGRRRGESHRRRRARAPWSRRTRQVVAGGPSVIRPGRPVAPTVRRRGRTGRRRTTSRPRWRTRAWYSTYAARRAGPGHPGPASSGGRSGSRRTCWRAAAPRANAGASWSRSPAASAAVTGTRSSRSRRAALGQVRERERGGDVDRLGRVRAGGPPLGLSGEHLSELLPAWPPAGGCAAVPTHRRAARRAAPRPRGAPERGPAGRVAGARSHHPEVPLARPGQQHGRQRPVLAGLAGPQRAGQLVAPGVRRQLAGVDHAGERDPGRALGDAQQPAPAHQQRARGGEGGGCRGAGWR